MMITYGCIDLIGVLFGICAMTCYLKTMIRSKIDLYK